MRKVIALPLLMLTATVNAQWNSTTKGIAVSEPIKQELNTGGEGIAQFYFVKGSINYITKSQVTKEICTQYPDVSTNEPIVAEGRKIPALTWCEGEMLATNIEGEAAQWLFEKLWKQRTVTIDGWKVNTDGFQQSVREMVN